MDNEQVITMLKAQVENLTKQNERLMQIIEMFANKDINVNITSGGTKIENK